MPHTETMLESKEIFKGRVIRVTLDTVRLENGNTSTREVVHHHGGACILPVDGDGNVYMVRQFRYAMGEEIWELPAGKLEAGEDPFEAAKRELGEECGLTADHFTDLGVVYATVGYDSEKIYVWAATGLHPVAQHLDPDEFLDVVKMPFDKALGMVLDGTMPSRINHLRVGELLLLGRVWGCDIPELHKDVFTLRAEVIEVKIKPSHPVGELSVDAFGRTRTYVDRGHRRRALLAMGRVDYGECEDLVSREPGLIMLGASSDHTLVDVQNTVRDIQVGDILEFDLCYATMVYLTHSESVHLVFRAETTSE